MEQTKQKETINPSLVSASNGTPPAYLTSTTLCMKQLPLAIATSLLTIIMLSIITINSSTLILQTETSHLLSLTLGLFFLLSCTAAVWKHTLKC